MSMEWTWYHPESLEEASRILADHSENAMLVAGGTAVALSPPRRDELHMIDLTRTGAEGQWAIDLPADKIGAAIEICVQSEAFGAVELDELGLISFRPVREIDTYPLAGR